MITYWACLRCEKVFKINTKIKKYCEKNHENPHCHCGCGVTKKVTEFHFEQYQKRKKKKIKQTRFALVPGLANDPRFEFLNEPIQETWKNRGDKEE